MLAAAGDRVVLRSAERRTVGGALVVDPHPPAGLRRGARRERLAVLAGGDPVAVLGLRLREAGAAGVPAGPAAEARPEAVVLGGLAPATPTSPRGRAPPCSAAVGQEGATVAAARAASGLPRSRRRGAGRAHGRRRRAGRARRPGRPARGGPGPDARGRGARPACSTPPGCGRRRSASSARRRALPPARCGPRSAALRDAGRVVQAGDLWFSAAALDERPRPGGRRPSSPGR